MEKIAMITGATSGIGRATARYFAQHGVGLILCGRRQDRLEALKKELGQWVRVHILNFDVRSRQAVFAALESLPTDFPEIDVLLNNAGNAHGLDPIQDGDPEDWDAMIDINVKGLLNVSWAVMPQMVARNAGHIINIGSIAAKEVYPNGNVYCASKQAVDAITQGMRIDLNPHGIRVGAVHPGLVETEFSEVRFKGDRERASRVYDGYRPLGPEDIADTIHFMANCPAHVNIADLVVLPTAQGSATLVNKKP